MEHKRFRLLVGPGYATLQPLLRARVLADRTGPPLPVYAPAGGLERLLAIDEPGLVDGAYRLREFAAGESFGLAPYAVDTGRCRTGYRTPGPASPPGTRCSATPGTPVPAPTSSNWPGTSTC
ncbi:hypothetical protein [Micromonospora sp. U56]|uniref:hypothetical protein n=1 Tax=Micromonospora sp. U56 TaxID=2824900 RepID=UPI001FFD1722|nr:hypothetical protein [Micromonospora sp. U56]